MSERSERAANDDARERRLAKNETFFREANEILEREAAKRGTGKREFICECSSEGCLERLVLSLDDYEQVREKGDWFVVSPGHENPSLEEVVERHATYFVVEKRGTAGAVARSEDPR